MFRKKTDFVVIVSIITVAVVAYVVYFRSTAPRTWQDVEREKTLRVVTSYNSVNYILDKGKPTGFGYDIIKSLADTMNLSLNVTIENSYSQCIAGLSTGVYDLMLDLMPITALSRNEMCMTSYIATSKLVLAQHIPDSLSTSFGFIGNTSQLDSVTVYMAAGSPYSMVLDNLMDETGVDFDVVEEDVSHADLIDLVETGDIACAAVDYLYTTHLHTHSSVNTGVGLGLDQLVGWPTSDRSTQLVVSQYIDSIRTTSWFLLTKQKYDIR